MNERSSLRWGGRAAMAYGVVSLAVLLTEAAVVGGTVPAPAALLVEVADDRAAWVLAEGALAASQVLLVPFGAALAVAARARSRAAVGAGLAFVGLAGLLSVLSGIFHGVLGVHLASPASVARPDPALLRDVELVHALGDTTFFAASVALGIAIVVLSAVLRADGRFPDGLFDLGLGTALVGLGQFAWFVLPAAGVLAPAAVLGQAVWLGWAGLRLSRLPAGS